MVQAWHAVIGGAYHSLIISRGHKASTGVQLRLTTHAVYD
jgi:hypothetical protein